MSTTTTSEPPRPRRRRLPALSAAGRRNQSRTPHFRGAPSAPSSGRPLVLDGRAEQKLLEASRRRGRKAAGHGALDPLVLHGDDRIPHFAELASVRDRVIREIAEKAHHAEEQGRFDDAHAQAEAERLRRETELIDRRLAETQEQIATTTRQLDLLAMRASRWSRFRDSVRTRLEERWIRARFPDPSTQVPAPQGSGDGAAPDPGEARQANTDPDWVTLHGAPEPPRRSDPPGNTPDTDEAGLARAWEGLHKRPGIPGWMTWALLGVILAVEVPIYWVAYQPFHGIGSISADAQTGMLAVSSAILMVLLPHLAGHVLRRRPETGAVRQAWVPAFLLLAVWAALASLLGTVRARYVMQTEEDTEAPRVPEGFTAPGADGAASTSLIDRLDLAPQTVTWLFVALLLLSGGIGFLLGLCREHPHLNAYRTAVERRAGLLRERELSVVEAELAQSTADTAEARREERRAAAEDRARAVRDLYEAAAHAYLDGVSLEAADPAVTEAAMRLSGMWPLLPATRQEPAF
ncbi:hypothetical protein ACGRHY_00555 [Streptomyces sp. HK10]|uniref:hypothetical protein n=1 Tax=Streptomyces sp. HK10 TaxID=3373255 RepID=UPI003747C216